MQTRLCPARAAAEQKDNSECEVDATASCRAEGVRSRGNKGKGVRPPQLQGGGGVHTQIAGVAQKGRAKIKSKQNTMKTTNGT